MRRSLFIGVGILAILLLGITARRSVHGLMLVVRAADLHGPIRRVADLDTVRISERIARVPVKDTPIRARVYAPVGAPVRLLLTNLISHAEADQPAHVTDVLRLAGFWGNLLER